MTPPSYPLASVAGLEGEKEGTGAVLLVLPAVFPLLDFQLSLSICAGESSGSGGPRG
jgi:hypothetical protein